MIKPSNTIQDSIYFGMAGFIIKINFRRIIEEKTRFDVKSNMLKIYKGFLIPGNPSRADFIINLSDKVPTLVLKKQEKYFMFFYEKDGKYSITANTQMGWIHFSLILKNVLSDLLQRKGLILHASAVMLNKKVIVFLGQSGAGKSTIAKILGEEGTLLADDSIIIKKEGKKYFLYQTPFVEKNRVIRTKNKYPLTHIMFLHKSPEFKLESIKKDIDVIKKLLNQLYSNKESISVDVKESLQFLTNFNNFYNLYFPKKSNVIELLKTRL